MFRRGRRKSGSDAPAPPDAPGWDAISTAFQRLYGDMEPIHRAPMPPLHLGGPLQGLSAYRAPDHWHLVTYGLTELYAKEAASDPLVSGWGYELTFRVAMAESPPEWAFNLLYRLADQTWKQSYVFQPGDRVDAGEPLSGGSSRLTGIAMTTDPQLEPIDTPNGQVTFLQAVGITGEELADMKASSTQAVLDRLADGNPLLVTDASR